MFFHIVKHLFVFLILLLYRPQAPVGCVREGGNSPDYLLYIMDFVLE